MLSSIMAVVMVEVVVVVVVVLESLKLAVITDLLQASYYQIIRIKNISKRKNTSLGFQDKSLIYSLLFVVEANSICMLLSDSNTD